jgi:hypothetical protein
MTLARIIAGVLAILLVRPSVVAGNASRGDVEGLLRSDHPTRQNRIEARSAIQTIGTNAIPVLLEALQKTIPRDVSGSSAE